MRQYKPGHPIGQRRLADAGRPADQPGVRHPPAAIGVEQRTFGLGVPEQRGGLPRMPQLFVIAAGGGTHEATPSSATGAVAGSSRSLTTLQIWSATAPRGPLASITTQRAGSHSACMPEGVAQPLVKIERLALETVGGLVAAPLLGTRQTRLRRHVEYEGEVGLERAHGHPLQRLEQVLVDAAERPLVDAGGVDEAIADHPAAAFQRGQDRMADVVVAGGREQDRFGGGAERLRSPRQQHVPDDLGAGRPARLPGQDHADPKRAQPLRQQRRMRRLAGPLPAFKGDESSAHTLKSRSG